MSLASGLFGTHVQWSSSQSPTLAIVLVSEGKSEIGDIGLTRSVDQDVARLDVPMDQSPCVSVMKGFGDVATNPADS